MTTFENWCALRGVSELPAMPADVAAFVSDCASLGMDKIWPMLQEISRAHSLIGLADPTQGGLVAAAVYSIAQIPAPRSFPKEMKARFPTLPYDMQVYLAGREVERDRTMWRAQNEAAEMRKRLAEVLTESPVATLLEQRKTNGIHSTKAA